ncbi:hypothetical protein CERSUDRAFT_73346 [Gelatoporia subvermispora B]|uniref:DUF6533 domain-containing protein n=1 Tax=Ceriporiopsis subvermispora (strain B) TaxID=914234 RepID=M2RG91_CERS8|nr:hypothetical protein CERSUDRAFT_73346 [Gelatoporia subvermispora B]
MMEIYGPVTDDIVGYAGALQVYKGGIPFIAVQGRLGKTKQYVCDDYNRMELTVLAAALVVCSHISTITEEIQRMWGSKLTITTILFYVNRWMVLVYALLEVIGIFIPYTSPVLRLAVLRGEYVRPLPGHSMDRVGLISIVFVTARAFAISGGNRLLSLVVALPSLVPVVIKAYTYISSNYPQLVTFPSIGRQCLVSKQHTPVTATTRLGISNQACFIMADIVVLYITLTKTWNTVHMARKQNVKTPLMTMLLRDGTRLYVHRDMHLVAQHEL